MKMSFKLQTYFNTAVATALHKLLIYIMEGFIN